MRKLLTLLLVLGASLAFGQQTNQDFFPASTGLNLGHQNQRWNGYFQNLKIFGTCTLGNGQSCFGGGSGTPVVFQTNGATNDNASLLNFVNTTSCTWTYNGNGSVSVACGAGTINGATANYGLQVSGTTLGIMPCPSGQSPQSTGSGYACAAAGGGGGNITAGSTQGQVATWDTGSSAYLPVSKAVIDPRDYGVDCSDTNDSTTAWAAAVTAAGNYGKIVVPQHCLFKLTGTPGFSLYKVYGLEIEFAGRQGNGCDNQNPNPSGIDYRQSYASGNTVVSILDSQRLLFKNLTIYTNGGADNGILLDQDLSTPPITTRNDFYNTCIYNNTASRNASWKGINVSPVSISNVENIHFYHPDISCSQSSPTGASSNGTAIWFGGSANLKNEIIDDYNAHNCSVDIFTQFGGDITTQFGLSSNSYSNVAMGAFNDSLYGFRTENATNAVSIVNPIGPHLIYHNDFAASAGTIIDCPSGCGALTLFNNQTDSTPGNWFNVHGGGAGASGPLIAFGNRNFSWTPTDWQLGAFVQSGFSVTSTFPRFLLTPPEASGSGVGGNVQSPAIDLQSLSGSGATTDDYIIQTLPSGNLSNTPASSTLALAHAQASTIAPWLATPATLSGLNLGQITNTANLTVTGRGATGSTSYSYVVVAHGNTGTTAASNTTTISNGNPTLTGTNFNLVIIPMVGGCTYFDVYRTASGGTPSSTGKIGTRDCFTTSHPAAVDASQLFFNDTGLAGDGTTAPVTNTTGQLTATGGTLTVNSNLTANNVTTGNLVINGSCTGCGGGGGSGTVTSVATTTPITGGPFSTTGTIACPTCVTSSSPGAGIAHFAGSTQAVTSSAVVDADLSGSVAVAHGGTGATTAAGALVNLFPAGTRIGDVAYCSAYAASACTAWTLLAGNNSGATAWLQEPTGGAAPSWTVPPGAGTVAVVSAGNLTSTALVTGGGTQLTQTPSATTTLDSSGNISAAAGGSVGSADTGTPKFTFATNLITANKQVTGTIFNATTGFAIPAATTAGHYLRNNATNFVDSAIQAGDLPSLSGTYLALTGGGTMNGNILFTDNLYDLGTVSATRPRSGYFATSLNAPTINAGTGFQIGGNAPLGHFLSGTGTYYADNGRLTDDGSTLSYTGAGGIQAASLSITSGFQIYSVNPTPAFAAVASNDGLGFSNDGNLYTSNNGGTPSQVLTAANGFGLLGSGTNTTGALVVGSGASLAPTSGSAGRITANAMVFASTTLTNNTLPTDGQCLGRSGTTIIGFACSGGSAGTFQTNAVNLTSSSTINFQNSAATNGLTLTFANPSAGNVKLGFTGTLTNAGLANSSTTVNGANCALGSACDVETAASGQLAVSGGSGAALTGAASLTYSGSTLSTTTAGIVDLSAATGSSAFIVPTNVSNTAGAAGVIDYDATAANYHINNGNDSIVVSFPTSASITNNNLIAWAKVGSNVTVAGAGIAKTDVVTAASAAGAANQIAYSTGASKALSFAVLDATATHVLHATTPPAFGAIVAGDLPGTLSASTAITNAVLTTPNIGTPSAGTLTNVTGLPVGGISATGTPSNTTYLRGDGSWQPATGTNGMSGMTAAQVPIAASANTVTSSEVLAGAGSGITTGPTTSTTGDVVSFTGTGGQIADSAVLAANLVTAASNYTSGQFVKAAGNNKTTSSAAIAAADLPAALDNSTSINGTSVALSKTLIYSDSATVNKVTLTAPATSATLTIADGKTLTATNTMNVSKQAGVAGAIPWYDTTTSQSATALLAANGVMIGGGASAAPATIAASTTTTQALFATAGAPAFRGVAAGDLPGTLTSGTAITNAALTTPAIGAATGTSLLVTGIVDGTVPVTVTTGTTATLGAATYKSGYTFNQEATAATGVTYTLPATAVGLQYCVRNSIVSGTGAADTGVLTVYPAASSYIILNGVRNTIGGGGTHGVASGGAAGDSACFVAVDATDWEVFVIRGTWASN